MAAQRYGLVGHPVTHSLSPAMQEAAFRELGIDAAYRLFDIQPEQLDAFLAGLREAGIAGVNVTIPHKVKARDYLERRGSLDDHARRLGAVNTVAVAADGSLRGYNTDGPGFYRSLVEDLRFEPERKTLCVLGSGGAATAVVMYLGATPEHIYVYDVDGAKAQALAGRYAAAFGAHKLTVVRDAGLPGAIAASDLLVNATPVGMKPADPPPVDPALLHQGLYVYDLVYNVPQTALVKEAVRMKRHAVTGLGMLLRQGAIACEIWTGRKAPVAVMKKALSAALKERA